jgi:hypothetical protein
VAAVGLRKRSMSGPALDHAILRHYPWASS